MVEEKFFVGNYLDPTLPKVFEAHFRFCQLFWVKWKKKISQNNETVFTCSVTFVNHSK